EALADLSRFFWDTVVGGRTFATGGTTNFEHWRTEWGKLASELGPESQETCCTYNMLKLTKHLFTWRSDVKYADYYERAVLNGILASQDPTTGMMMYYGALKGGHWKIFNEHGKCFWCCTGTGFENHVKYGEAIYFHDDDSLTVNLFIASQLTWADKGLVVRQETNFPEQEGTNLMFSCEKPVELALHVRVPYWAVNGVIVKINGIEQDLKAQRGSYLVVERAWADGDCVAISMPMSLHLHRMPDDPNVAAIMYGPVVLAGRLGSDGLDREMIYIVDQRAMNHADDWPVPHFIVDTDDLNAWIKPVPGEGLMFHTAGAGDPTDVMLVPLYKITGERQSVYWTISTAEQWAARCAAAAERRRRIAEDRAAFVETVLDSVIIGDGASEAAHNMQTEGSETGTREGRSWREARGGQTFSYDMSIAARPKGKPIAVKCTYWGGDTGRIFHVTVGAWKIGMVTLNNERPGEFFEAEYRIPEFLLGEETLTIGFRAHAGNIAGAVYACRIATCWPGPEDDLQPYDD
ncbi:MAG: glycoside hydrolase family 127 protein, partial [Phycisphaerae bacterium]|nr:glycoside hydrolase family 127 protein [Phycisphaerae bacterium]